MGKILFAFNRLREPSSLSAISAMLAMCGYQLPPGILDTIVNFGVVVFGLAGVFVKEGKPETVVKGF